MLNKISHHFYTSSSNSCPLFSMSLGSPSSMSNGVPLARGVAVEGEAEGAVPVGGGNGVRGVIGVGCVGGVRGCGIVRGVAVTSCSPASFVV